MTAEKSVEDFVYAICAAVDHAGNEVNNSGILWKQPAGDLDHVKFPAPINALLPGGIDLKGESLSITARDWHGRGEDELSFWLETKSRPGWEMPAILGHYSSPPEFNSFRIGNESVDEHTFSQYCTSYMSLLPDLQTYIATHGMALAFRRGISYTAESGIAQNHIVKRTGHKATSNAYSLNGFQFVASVSDETDQDGETKTTVATELSYFFQPSIEEMPYRGRLLKTLSVILQNDEITTSKKESQITLMNNPYINGGKIGAYADGSASDESGLPARLQEQLYSDDTVRAGDVSYFINLATKPLSEADITIL